MTQDFAKKPRNERQPKGKKSRAGKHTQGQLQRKSTAPAAPRSNVPGWVWLFTGTVLGAFIMFLVYLSDLTPAPARSQSKPVAAVVEKGDKGSNPLPKPRFDFYKLLKESEVVVPQAPVTSTQPSKPSESLEYILQVASFKNPADADRLRAELILLNLDANTEKVTVRNGETWYRVLVGPFVNRSKMAKARSTLVSNNLNTLVLKRKVSG